MNTTAGQKAGGCGGCAPRGPIVGSGNGEEDELPSGATNPCKLCTPLGACLAFKGVSGCVPLLHGSQGCATYIRRYCISHFREPIDVASSNFSEDSAVFGGRRNLHLALDNITRQYRPELIGVATTCLSETMGENMPMLLAEYRNERKADAEGGEGPALVHVSTPSFRGTHAEGFHAAVAALVDALVPASAPTPAPATMPTAATILAPASAARVDRPPQPLALFPGMVSPADLRHLRDLFDWWRVPVCILPDYSETLDGPSWAGYERLPAGGTSIDEIRALGGAPAALECGRVLAGVQKTAGTILAARCGVPHHRLGLPVGLRECDRFCEALAEATGLPVPERVARERGRLIDSYVDGHKYLSGKKAVVYGEADMVAALAIFLAETGVVPSLCASGERSGRLAKAIFESAPELEGRIEVFEGSDFEDISERVADLAPDLLVGSSKGHKLARSLEVPLVRCGFPIHDRIGAQRQQWLGYQGTQQLYDRIANALLERKQDASPIGYSYL